MEFNRAAPRTAARLAAAEVGQPHWWQALAEAGVPLQEPVSARTVCVTFVWRDPHGDETHSDTRRVYVDVNSVTDHHSPDPQSLARIAGTDAWFWQVELPADWRGSYAFIPVGARQLPPAFEGDAEARNLAQRHWWRSIMDRAIADPLNPLGHRSNWGATLSALHLPQAPDQSAWQAVDAGKTAADLARLRQLDWNGRRVWLYATNPTTAGPRPRVLLLDGQGWFERGIAAALDADTARGRLPPADYVLIESLDREAEFGCRPAFWLALQDDLLPRLDRFAPAGAAFTAVAGQSLGGLGAMYAGLHWPERFGRVLSQSGSFWWPKVDLLQAPPGEPCARKPGSRGRLAEQLVAGELGRNGRLKVWLEVGSREDVMIDVNDSLCDALRDAGHTVRYRLYEGGHDGLCWRGGLLDGLAWLLAD